MVGDQIERFGERHAGGVDIGPDAGQHRTGDDQRGVVDVDAAAVAPGRRIDDRRLTQERFAAAGQRQPAAVAVGERIVDRDVPDLGVDAGQADRSAIGGRTVADERHRFDRQRPAAGPDAAAVRIRAGRHRIADQRVEHPHVGPVGVDAAAGRLGAVGSVAVDQRPFDRQCPADDIHRPARRGGAAGRIEFQTRIDDADVGVVERRQRPAGGERRDGLVADQRDVPERQRAAAAVQDRAAAAAVRVAQRVDLRPAAGDVDRFEGDVAVAADAERAAAGVGVDDRQTGAAAEDADGRIDQNLAERGVQLDRRRQSVVERDQIGAVAPGGDRDRLPQRDVVRVGPGIGIRFVGDGGHDDRRVGDVERDRNGRRVPGVVGQRDVADGRADRQRPAVDGRRNDPAGHVAGAVDDRLDQRRVVRRDAGRRRRHDGDRPPGGIERRPGCIDDADGDVAGRRVAGVVPGGQRHGGVADRDVDDVAGQDGADVDDVDDRHRTADVSGVTARPVRLDRDHVVDRDHRRGPVDDVDLTRECHRVAGIVGGGEVQHADAQRIRRRGVGRDRDVVVERVRRGGQRDVGVQRRGRSGVTPGGVALQRQVVRGQEQGRRGVLADRHAGIGQDRQFEGRQRLRHRAGGDDGAAGIGDRQQVRFAVAQVPQVFERHVGIERIGRRQRHVVAEL